MSGSLDVRWAADLASYEQLAARAGERAVAVLAPREQQRRDRWSEVLAWYEPRGSSAKPPARAHAERRGGCGRDVVVALDEQFAAPAKAYADALGRPFRRMPANSAVPALVSKGDRTLLLVGSVERFRGPVLARLTRELTLPWGVLTAADLPGITFALAKLRAAYWLTRRPSAVVNTLIDGTISTVDSDGRPATSEMLSRERLWAVLGELGWDGLALFAHGEGGHFYLGTAVLCGLLGSAERSLEGEVLDGCRLDEGALRCKRVTRTDVRAMSFSELRASQVALIGCTTCPVAGELYPSTVSSVLSAAEGYPASIIATTGRVVVDVWEPKIVLGVVAQRLPMSAALDVLNELHERYTGKRPYLLFGDPAGERLEVTQPEPDGWVGLEPDRVVTAVSLNAERTPTVTGIEPRMSGLQLVRGARLGVVISHIGRTRDVVLVDHRGRFDACRQWLRQIAERLPRAVWLEHALMRAIAANPWPPEGVDGAAARLRDLRLRVERGLQDALACGEMCRRRGIWDDELERLRIRCATYVGMWDECLAALVRDYMSTDGLEIFDLFADAFELLAPVAGSRCEHCGSLLLERRGRAPLDHQPDQIRVSCAMCGEREAWREGDVRIVLNALPTLQRGSTVRIGVRLARPPAAWRDGVPNGHLPVAGYDRVRSHAFLWTTERLSAAGECEIIQLVGDVAAELHTLQVAWIHGLDVTVQRRRWPTLPVR